MSHHDPPFNESDHGSNVGDFPGVAHNGLASPPPLAALPSPQLANIERLLEAQAQEARARAQAQDTHAHDALMASSALLAAIQALSNRVLPPFPTPSACLAPAPCVLIRAWLPQHVPPRQSLNARPRKALKPRARPSSLARHSRPSARPSTAQARAKPPFGQGFP